MGKLLPLQFKYGLSSDDYKSWDHERIYVWIMSLDEGRYKQYGDELKHNLQQQDIKGEDLRNFDTNDVLQLGVAKFKDKKALFNSIQELIN